MYLAGFALLPWLWFVNYLLFRKELLKPTVPYELKLYVSRSLLLSLASLTAFLLWFIIYQSSWHRWGTFGDNLAMNIPKGGR
jgi:hypothetical protein